MRDHAARLDAHKTLLKAKDDLLRKRHLEGQLDRVEQALREQRDRLQELERICRRESDDVRRLTRLSVAALVTSLLGTKEQRLSKERQELAAATLKLEAAREAEAACEMDRDRLADELSHFAGADASYAAALAAKEALLRLEGGVGISLAALADEEAENRERARELSEAIESGSEAKRRMEEVVAGLRSASNWGTWDMFGGGMISTAIKHSRLDDARSAASLAQRALHRFGRELADIGQELTASIDIGDFSRFADYFFDGFIMDWVVQSKISNALSLAEQADSRIDTILSRLHVDQERRAKLESDLGSRRRELIEKS